MYYTDEQDRPAPITIRPARPDDREALRRLAQLESAEVPGGELLVAQVGGRLRAAVSVEGGEAIADPFQPSAELIRLLSTRARQMRRSRNGRAGPRFLRRLRRSGRPSGFAPQPAGTVRVTD